MSLVVAGTMVRNALARLFVEANKTNLTTEAWRVLGRNLGVGYQSVRRARQGHRIRERTDRRIENALHALGQLREKPGVR